MTAITLDEIQRDLLGYLQRVEAGETLLILDEDRPMAEIKPVAHPPGNRRPYALCAGEFRVPDDFDEPLPDEVLDLFTGP